MDDITKLKRYLLYWINLHKSRGHKFYNINQMTIKSTSDKCNMKYEHYMNQPMQPVELRINLLVAKNPQMINSFERNKNHPLIRKNSHIPFN